LAGYAGSLPQSRVKGRGERSDVLGGNKGRTMTLLTKSAEESDHKLSKKELSKKLRHEAYSRAKEYRKTDPRQIAMKEKLKEQRREAYQRAKERNKAYRDEIRKASKEKAGKKKVVKQNKLMKMVVPGNTIKRPDHEPGTI
jgi:hypothetical protein